MNKTENSVFYELANVLAEYGSLYVDNNTSYLFHINTLQKEYGTLEISVQENHFIIEKNEFPLVARTHEQVFFLENALSDFFLDLKWTEHHFSITFKAVAHTLDELIRLISIVKRTLTIHSV